MSRNGTEAGRRCEVKTQGDAIQVMIPEGAIAGSQIKWRLADGRWIQASE